MGLSTVLLQKKSFHALVLWKSWTQSSRDWQERAKNRIIGSRIIGQFAKKSNMIMDTGVFGYVYPQA